MMSHGESRVPKPASADHAGSVLCRLLIAHPEVVDIEILGQDELSDGTISYWLGVMLPDGRELLVEVGDTLVTRPG
jgi:hypothetical protein